MKKYRLTSGMVAAISLVIGIALVTALVRNRQSQTGKYAHTWGCSPPTKYEADMISATRDVQEVVNAPRQLSVKALETSTLANEGTSSTDNHQLGYFKLELSPPRTNADGNEKAIKQYLKGEDVLAIRALQKLEQSQAISSMGRYYLALLLAKKGESALATKQLYIAMHNDYPNFQKRLREEPIFQPITSSSEFRVLTSRIEHRWKQALMQGLPCISYIDGYLRPGVLINEERFLPSSPVADGAIGGLFFQDLGLTALLTGKVGAGEHFRKTKLHVTSISNLTVPKIQEVDASSGHLSAVKLTQQKDSLAIAILNYVAGAEFSTIGTISSQNAANPSSSGHPRLILTIYPSGSILDYDLSSKLIKINIPQEVKFLSSPHRSILPLPDNRHVVVMSSVLTCGGPDGDGIAEHEVVLVNIADRTVRALSKGSKAAAVMIDNESNLYIQIGEKLQSFRPPYNMKAVLMPGIKIVNIAKEPECDL